MILAVSCSLAAPCERQQTLQDALSDLDRQLAPIAAERLAQIAMRLMFHYPKMTAETYRHYLLQLKYYPEDLVCAAYQHALRHGGQNVPQSADMILFMQPEMNYRRACREKLEHLLQQAQVLA